MDCCLASLVMAKGKFAGESGGCWVTSFGALSGEEVLAERSEPVTFFVAGSERSLCEME